MALVSPLPSSSSTSLDAFSKSPTSSSTYVRSPVPSHSRASPSSSMGGPTVAGVGAGGSRSNSSLGYHSSSSTSTIPYTASPNNRTSPHPSPPFIELSTISSRGSNKAGSPAHFQPLHHQHSAPSMHHVHSSSTSSSTLQRPPSAHLHSSPRSTSPHAHAPHHQHQQSGGNGQQSVPARSTFASPAISTSHHPGMSQQQQPQHQQPQYPLQFPSKYNSNSNGNVGQYSFPHPHYPFIPSPHPQQNLTNPLHHYNQNQQPQPTLGPYSPGFHPGSTTDQQHAMMMHQAHLQQHQWQMDMIRSAKQHQQNAIEQQRMAPQQLQHQQNSANSRPRAQSGPSPHSNNSKQQFYASSSAYPPSPAPSLNQYLPQDQKIGGAAGFPTYPAGAMVPQLGGYPTPPGSTEGNSGSSSGGGGSGSGRDSHHPYRRPGKDEYHVGTRSQSHNRTPGHSSASSGSFSSSSHPTTNSTSASSIYTSSSAKNSASSVSSPAASRSTSARSTPPPAAQAPPIPFPSSVDATNRQRTDSQHTSSSYQSSSDSRATTAIDQKDRRQDSSGSSGTTSRNSARESLETSRSTTPVQPLHGVAQKKPSPLGRKPSEEHLRPSTPGAFLGVGDDGEESDDTTPAPVKAKKGMGQKFRRAFGGASSSSSSNNLALTDAEVDGRGPKTVTVRRGSASSDDVPLSSAGIGGRRTPKLASSSASVMTGVSNATSKPPTAKRGIFNGKFNASTDNISISSTVSSASVMIRKIGQMGKLARRNSLMSLTKAFKSNKDKDGDVVQEDKKAHKRAGSSSTATTSVSHATAEHEGRGSANAPGMSPAAALARQQQQHYAEQEAAAAAAAEAHRQAEAARLAAATPTKGSFVVLHQRDDSVGASSTDGDGSWGRSKTPDLENSNGPSGKSKALEKEKEKIKTRRKWGLGFSASSSNLKEASQTESAFANGDRISFAEDVERSAALAAPRANGVADFYDDGRTQPTVGTSGVEVLSYQPNFGESFKSEYEASLHERSAHGGLREPLRQVTQVRGILKGAGTYRQGDFELNKPQFPRLRASSFDAPTQQSSSSPRPNSAGSGNAPKTTLISLIPSENQVDGLVSNHSHRDRAPSTSSSPYSNPSLNVSAPILSQVRSSSPLRSPNALPKRRISFAPNLSVHTTWPASAYDRRAEPATCNRLTPTLAQQIKEELNSYKMEEMDVHPSSRQLTHFCESHDSCCQLGKGC